MSSLSFPDSPWFNHREHEGCTESTKAVFVMLTEEASKESQEPRAKSQESRAKTQEPRAKSQEPRAKCQEHRT